jgi:hypothetical protein
MRGRMLWVGMLLAGCVLAHGSAQAGSTASLKPVTGTWEFRETGSARTGGRIVQQRFLLSTAVQRTCLGGETWYRAERLGSPADTRLPAAWQYKDGKLAIMLDAQICDGYTFYEGKVKRGVFAGRFIDAPWGHAVKGAAVNGRRLP